MNKCNVANGWCPCFSKSYLDNCWINEVGFKNIEICSHRLLMNRLEEAQNKSILTSVNLDMQWNKEIGESK